jgi:hypothetical protein
MAASMDRTSSTGVAPGWHAPCPPWCVVQHGVQMGEEDWVHLSDPLEISDDVYAQACMSTVPPGQVTDGPYVLIGWRQYTADEAAVLGEALIALARTAGEVSGPAGS